MIRAAAAAALVLLTAATARADAISFNLVPKVMSGSRQKPSLSVTTNEPVQNVEVRLTRDDGKAVKLDTGKLPAGATRSLVLDPGTGEHHFKGTLAVIQSGGRSEMELDFDAEVVAPPQLTLDKSKVDLKSHTLELVSSRKTAKVEVEVTGDNGESLGTTEVPFENAKAGTPLKVSWKQSDGTVLKIALKVWDPDNFYSGIELFPWQISIPHEEVNFASGSAALDRAEEPKVAKSLELIGEAIQKYGRFADIKLYVAGHTDTVGPADANRALSLNRAKAIAQYFRKRGVRVPIFYEGFGEDALAVSTPDETAEVKNRRAEYIVAIDEPNISGSGHAAGWKALK